MDQATPVRTEWIPVPKLPAGLTVADFDGDGNQDIAVGNFQGKEIHWLRNQWKQPGHFALPQAVIAGWFEKYTSPNFLQVGDINQDGFLDLVANNFSWGAISILVSNPLDQ